MLSTHISTTPLERGGQAEEDNGNSDSYLIGAILFSVAVACAFVVAISHMARGVKRRREKTSLVVETDKVSESGTFTPQDDDDSDDCERSEQVPDLLDRPPSRDTLASHLRCDIEAGGRKPVTFGIACEPPFLHEQPYIDSGASRNWIGSPEWCAARKSRKQRLEELFQTSLFTGKINQPISKPDIDNPPAPLAPPPKLEILLPCANMDDPDSSRWVAEANALVLAQLQYTASDDLSLRKKRFKSLCARWHPDKNSSENVEFTTEVFQYLQAQKTWYLERQDVLTQKLRSKTSLL